MALGTAELSPLQVVTGYAAFANGGFRVTPYYIDRILDASGKTIYQAEPLIACAQCAAGADSTGAVNAALADGRPPAGAGLIATAAATGANTPTAPAPSAARAAHTRCRRRGTPAHATASSMRACTTASR